MKKTIHTLICAVLLVLLVTAVPGQAFAQGGSDMTVPVKTIVEGAFPQTPETFTLELKAVTEGAPMPEGSVNGLSTMKLKGNDQQDIAISYPNLGIYRYALRQLPGNTDNCTYDRRIYELEVSVVNAEQGDGIVITVAINVKGETEKCKEISFVNKYAWPDAKPKTGDDAPVVLFAGLSLASLMAAAVLLSMLKKQK